MSIIGKNTKLTIASYNKTAEQYAENVAELHKYSASSKLFTIFLGIIIFI